MRNVYKGRSAFLVNCATMKPRKTREAYTKDKRSFTPLIRPLCQFENASHPTRPILSDFSLLDPERFQDANTRSMLPADAFKNMAQNYGLDEEKLKAEYFSFVATYPKLKEKDPPKDLSPGSNTDVKHFQGLRCHEILQGGLHCRIGTLRNCTMLALRDYSLTSLWSPGHQQRSRINFSVRSRP